MKKLDQSIKGVLIFFLIAISTLGSLAQSKRDLLAMEAAARDLFDKNQYKQALSIYLELDSIKPDNPHYIYPIGICYINQDDEKNALRYFEKCLRQPELFPAKLYYYAGRCNHLKHKFDEAISYYQTYKSKLKGKKRNQLITLIDREIEMCWNGKELISKPLDIEIVNIGKEINSPYPDYGPVLSADGKVLIFTSCRPNTTGGLRDPLDGTYYEDVYISYKDESGIWSEPKPIGPSINTSGHDASIALSPDGQKLLIYRYGGNALGLTSSGDLYISTLEGNTWTEAQKLPSVINSKGWEPSASFSADEKLLYFSSDREGGYGGTDIYVVRKLPNGEWALPMNMGPVINTPYDEDAPFIHPDGKTLYFISNGHKSMGGHDIFVSKYDEEKKAWSSPVNVGYPINTAHNDLYFTWSANGKRIYFSSVRPDGYGEKDIYYADIEKESAEIMVMKGIIFDSISIEPVKASIIVTDHKTEELIGIFNSNSSTGKYILVLNEGRKYNIKIESDNYEVCNDIIDLEGLTEYQEVEKNIKLCPKKLRP